MALLDSKDAADVTASDLETGLQSASQLPEKKADLAADVEIGPESVTPPLDDDDLELMDAKEISAYVDFIVPLTDDPSTPTVTIRAFVLATFWGFVSSWLNAVLQFRSSPFTINPLIAVLLSYPVGVLWAKALPRHWLINPGPFSIKEHLLIYVVANSASAAYGLDNVVVQASPLFINNGAITFFQSLMYVFGTQFIGFGLAGLCRRFLVYPKAMWWPGSMSTIALFVSFHNPATQTLDTGKYKWSRYTFFWIAFAGMFAYTFLPEFFFPVLQSVSLLCLFGSTRGGGPGVGNIISPDSGTTGGAPLVGDQPGVLNRQNLLSSSINGFGIGALTFDWYYITSVYVTTPFWAILNYIGGNILFGWILGPIFFDYDVWGLNNVMTEDGVNPAINTAHLYIGNPNASSNSDAFGSSIGLGQRIKPVQLYSSVDYSLNETAYDMVAPIRITSYFAMNYMFLFANIAAVISHVALFYGADIKRQLGSALKQVRDSVDAEDVHNKLMRSYPEVPDWVYLAFLGVNTLIMLLVSTLTPYSMPWWAVFLNLVMAAVFILPIGVVQAISGTSIGLNVLTEFVIGLILPGQTIAVMCFKSLGTNNLIQALQLVSDLKIGHYLHIAPWAMVGAQLYGTLLSVIAGTAGTWIMMFNFSTLVSFKSVDWNAINYQIFYNAGAIWGAIGPVRFFGVNAVYSVSLWGFLIGFAAPFLPWAMNKYVYKHKYWHLVNFPLIFYFYGPGGPQNFNVVPLIVGYIFQVFMFKYRKEWYQKYNYVMGAAFDGGSTIAVIFIAGLAIGNYDFTAYINALNPNQSNGWLDYYCYPDLTYVDYSCSYYVTQMGEAEANVTADYPTCWGPTGASILSP